MSLLTIHRAKPNPAGKDTCNGYASAKQLLGEFVELKNTSGQNISLGGFAVANLEFATGCIAKPKPVIYWQGKVGEVLRPGQTARIHTGSESDSFRMAYEDAIGTDLHSFANKGWFVLNNVCGDTISVWKQSGDTWILVDQARYDRNPSEGVVLIRSGEKLVAPVRSLLTSV